MTEQVQEETQQLDRKDVKILAYKQANMELQEKIADLIVDRAFLSDQLENATKQLQDYDNQKAANVLPKDPGTPKDTD